MIMNNLVITNRVFDFDYPGLRSDQVRCWGEFTAKADRGVLHTDLLNASLVSVPFLHNKIRSSDNGGVEGSFDIVCLIKP